MKYAWDAFELRGSEVSPEMLDKTYQICSRLNQKVPSLRHFMINLTLLFNNFDCVKKKKEASSQVEPTVMKMCRLQRESS